MFKEYLLILLAGHVLGDFYFQSNKMAQRKKRNIKWVMLHCLCYLAVMIFVCIPVFSWHILIGAVCAGGFHFLIDFVKFIYVSIKYKKSEITAAAERNIYFADQLIHGIGLLGVAYWLSASNILINEWGLFKNLFDVMGIPETVLLSWIAALLLIHKPSNITIQKLLMIYKPDNKEPNKKNDKNAGRFIGTVERIIMLIFLSIGQYSAIGLVLTAKSIARFDRISKEEDFAEYYLLGTLISTVIVIVCSFII